jgi:hypothetical protein
MASDHHEGINIGQFAEEITAIRREVFRQAEERLARGYITPGDVQEPLLDHLTKSTNSIRTRVDGKVMGLWRDCVSGSHALSSDIRALNLGPLEFVKPAADAVGRWEGALTGLVKEITRNEKGDKVDADGFVAICRTLGGVIEEVRGKVANAQNIGPRDRLFLDQYLRRTARSLGELLTAVPPRDWLTGDNPESRLNERVEALRKLDSPREESAEKILLDHPERLANLWDDITTDALRNLSAETRGQLAEAFSPNLTEELARFERSNDREAEQHAWKIASILSDFAAQLRARTFGRTGWADEEQLARMEEALSAIGEAVSRKLGRK